MARSYGNIPTAIWRDPDFRARSGPAQHLFLMLMTQPDISAAGVLSMALTRWASRTGGMTRGQLRGPLEELEEHGWIVVDELSEELLVRPFVDWDKGHANPKRQPSIRDAAEDVESVRIRRALGREFVRLGVSRRCVPDSYGTPEWLSATQPDTHADRHSEPPETDDYSEDKNGYPGESSQVDSLSDTHADRVSSRDRVVVTEDLEGPQPTFREPQPTTRPPSLRSGGPRGREHDDRPPAPPSTSNDHGPPDRCPDHLDDVDPPPCGRCAGARKARHRWETAQRKAQAADRSVAARHAAQTTAAAIAACDQCDHRGRLAGDQLCHHDPSNAERATRGAAAVRSQIRRPAQ